MFSDFTSERPEGFEHLITLDPAADPTAWPFEVPYSAVVLFEALPEAFTLDDLFQVGEGQGHSSTRSVEHLRT